MTRGSRFQMYNKKGGKNLLPSIGIGQLHHLSMILVKNLGNSTVQFEIVF